MDVDLVAAVVAVGFTIGVVGVWIVVIRQILDTGVETDEP